METANAKWVLCAFMSIFLMNHLCNGLPQVSDKEYDPNCVVDPNEPKPWEDDNYMDCLHKGNVTGEITYMYCCHLDGKLGCCHYSGSTDKMVHVGVPIISVAIVATVAMVLFVYCRSDIVPCLIKMKRKWCNRQPHKRFDSEKNHFAKSENQTPSQSLPYNKSCEHEGNSDLADDNDVILEIRDGQNHGAKYRKM